MVHREAGSHVAFRRPRHGAGCLEEHRGSALRAVRRPLSRSDVVIDAAVIRTGRAASFAATPLAEPLNPPVQDAGLKAPPRLVRPGLLARAR